MDWRLRVPSAVYRLAVSRAGSDRLLADLVRAWLERYVAGVSPAAELGRKGGQARAEKLSPERRSEIARVAGRARHYPKQEGEP